MSWHQDGYDRGYKDGLEGNEDKSRDRYIHELIFPGADLEEAFWDGYEDGYENGKEAREENKED